jgi:hypothetical protein
LPIQASLLYFIAHKLLKGAVSNPKTMLTDI